MTAGAASPMELPGRHILVTGAASGIGRATAVLLSRLGACVTCADINSAGIDETLGLLAGEGHHAAQPYDFRDIEGVGAWLFTVAASFGNLRGFVHAAGIPSPVPVRALSVQQWREAFAINAEAALALSKAFQSRRVCDQAGGSIVFISSVMAQVGSPGAAAYSLSKGALDGVMRSLALEFAPRIRVNCVAPGFVRTPMLLRIEHLWTEEQRAQVEKLHPLGLGQPEDVANAVAFLLADSARWITGTVLVVDGGYTAQ